MNPRGDIRAIWFIGLALSIILLQTYVMAAEGLSPEDARRYVRDIYRRLREAEMRGADVQEAAFKLDEALELLREAEGDPSEMEKRILKAISIAREVEVSIGRLVEEGEVANRWRIITLSSSVALAILGSILTYIYAPRIFWGLWLRARRDWKVKRLD